MGTFTKASKLLGARGASLGPTGNKRYLRGFPEL